jgi:hypothetical protein
MRHLMNTTRSSALWGKAGGGRVLVLVLMLLVTVALAICSAAAMLPAASWND